MGKALYPPEMPAELRSARGGQVGCVASALSMTADQAIMGGTEAGSPCAGQQPRRAFVLRPDVAEGQARAGAGHVAKPPRWRRCRQRSTVRSRWSDALSGSDSSTLGPEELRKCFRTQGYPVAQTPPASPLTRPSSATPLCTAQLFPWATCSRTAGQQGRCLTSIIAGARCASASAASHCKARMASSACSSRHEAIWATGFSL